jgi:hypothetical protein
MTMISGGKAREGGRPKIRPAALMLGVLAMGGLMLYAVATADHQAFDLGYNVAGERVSVQAWSVQLPAGYELVWWRSTPASPQDGLRFFPPR